MECCASKGSVRKNPRSVGSTSFRREAGSRQGRPSAQVGEGWCLNPPNLVRHHPNPQPQLWVGSGLALWGHSHLFSCPLIMETGQCSAALGTQGPPGSLTRPHAPSRTDGGIRINESYSWSKCCFQPRVVFLLWICLSHSN